jgi:hypothetical protein
MTSPRNSCSVCGETLDEYSEAFCNACGLPYHLNQRSDREGKDCGEVWISEEHLCLEFACNTCLHPEPETGLLDDVLDLAEAAQVAKVSEAVLAEAAVAGALPHRRTSSGIYLFQRGDLHEFAKGRNE